MPQLIEASGVPVRCSHSKIEDVVNLVEHPRNPNKHPDSQVALLAKVIRHQGWRSPIVVSKRSGFIVSGHGRLAAAKLLNVQTVPVDFQEFETEADELAHLLADNRIAELADMDGVELSALLDELERGEYDLGLVGFDADELVTRADALPEPPPEVDENLAKMDEIKAQRKRGNEAINTKNDTEFFIVIVFNDRAGKNACLASLGLPEDERYVSSDAVRIYRKKTKHLDLPKSSPATKSGACG